MPTDAADDATMPLRVVANPFTGEPERYRNWTCPLNTNASFSTTTTSPSTSPSTTADMNAGRAWQCLNRFPVTVGDATANASVPWLYFSTDSWLRQLEHTVYGAAEGTAAPDTRATAAHAVLVDCGAEERTLFGGDLPYLRNTLQLSEDVIAGSLVCVTNALTTRNDRGQKHSPPSSASVVATVAA